MRNEIKSWFRKPSPIEVAAREMNEAELARLAAQTAREYASAMADYHLTRTLRLKDYLQAQTVKEPTI